MIFVLFSGQVIKWLLVLAGQSICEVWLLFVAFLLGCYLGDEELSLEEGGGRWCGRGDRLLLLQCTHQAPT